MNAQVVSLSGSARTPRGEHVGIAWLGWRRGGAAATVKFELKRVFKSFGYVESTENTSCASRVRQLKAPWEHFFELVGLAPPFEGVLYGRSAHSVAQRGGGLDDANLEDEYWVTAVGLLLLFVFFVGYRKATGREIATSTFKLFLELTLEVGDLARLDLKNIADAELLRKCDHAGADGVCDCYPQFLRDLGPAGANVYELAVGHSIEFNSNGECKAVCEHMRRLCTWVAWAVESRFEAF